TLGEIGELSRRGLDGDQTHHAQDGEFWIHVLAGLEQVEVFHRIRRVKGLSTKPAELPGGTGRLINNLAEGSADGQEAESGVDCTVRARSILPHRVSGTVLEGPTEEQSILIDALID